MTFMIAQNGVCHSSWLNGRSFYIEENSDRAGQRFLSIAHGMSKSQSAQHGDRLPPRLPDPREFPAAGDREDEGRGLGNGAVGHARQSIPEKVRHLPPGYVLLSQKEGADVGGLQRGSLDAVAADAFVLGEHYPAAAADFGQPVDIGCGLGEMIIVDFDRGANLAQCFCNLLAAETAVDEEDETADALRRHAASGSSLRTISSISVRERP